MLACKIAAQPGGDSHGDGMRSARIGMQVALQVPAGIRPDLQEFYAGLFENPLPQCLFDRSFATKLRVHHQGYRAMPARQGCGRKQFRPRRRNALFDGHLAVIRHQEPEKRAEPQTIATTNARD